MLKMGIGVDMNLEDSMHYFQYGYYLLHEECAYELSMIYFDGILSAKDEKKALTYLHQAARLRSEKSCMLLAQFYELGRYVKKNHRLALSYYQQAQSIREVLSKQNEIV